MGRIENMIVSVKSVQMTEESTDSALRYGTVDDRHTKTTYCTQSKLVRRVICFTVDVKYNRHTKTTYCAILNPN